MISVKEQYHYFTPEEFFAWEELQLEKHELIDGSVYAMAGGTRNHSAIKLNIAVLLKDHLRGSKCRIFNSDLKINRDFQVNNDSLQLRSSVMLPFSLNLTKSATDKSTISKLLETFRYNLTLSLKSAQPSTII